MADVLSRTDRVLRFGRAARPLSLFDRCARRTVITHGVFQASCWLFGRDYALFRSSEAAQRPKRELRKRFSTWIEAHGRKRPTLVSVSGRVLAPEPFAPDAVGEVAVPTGQSQTESRST